MSESLPGSALKKSARPDTQSPLVVCVDDEPEILRALSRLLRDQPYQFRCTTDPEEALEWVRRQHVSLLVADYRMPRMSGTTLLQLAKACSPRTERLMLTGYPGETLVISAGEAGLMHLVGKPWDDAFLKTKIQSLLCRLEDENGDRPPEDAAV